MAEKNRYRNLQNSKFSMDDSYAGSNVELASLAQDAGSMAGADGNTILIECHEIDREIGDIERDLEKLRQRQQRAFNDADSSSSSVANRQVDTVSDHTMSLYHKLTERIRTVKSNPEANSLRINPRSAASIAV